MTLSSGEEEGALLAPPVSSGDTPVRARTTPNITPLSRVVSPLSRVASPLSRATSSPSLRVVSPRPSNGSRRRADRSPLVVVAAAVNVTPNRVNVHHDDDDGGGGGVPSADLRWSALRARGTALHARAVAEGRVADASTNHHLAPRSAKQGPSHRKVRRWNNDRLIGVASELSSAVSIKAFHEGEARAHLFAKVGPATGEYRSVFGKLCTDDSQRARAVKERFLRGEVASVPSPRRRRKDDDDDDLSRRVPARLLNVLRRTCGTDGEASRTLDAFERHLVSVRDDLENDYVVVKRDGDDGDDDRAWYDAWEGVLSRPPTVLRDDDETTTIVYAFRDDDPSRAARNRLLLHAACLYHGVRSATDDDDARVVTATARARASDRRTTRTMTTTMTDEPRLSERLRASSSERRTGGDGGGSSAPVAVVVE